ncbi:Transmembrane protein [Orchesella cincta]|uniref:Transmembrane protein 198 n=1 Tax=Orchesella cincta TaxID=48709 RepID=A0A1D2N032_ORCCI|nr:Transmembrane protein [Orchesella cincta]
MLCGTLLMAFYTIPSLFEFQSSDEDLIIIKYEPRRRRGRPGDYGYTLIHIFDARSPRQNGGQPSPPVSGPDSRVEATLVRHHHFSTKLLSNGPLRGTPTKTLAGPAPPSRIPPSRPGGRALWLLTPATLYPLRSCFPTHRLYLHPQHRRAHRTPTAIPSVDFDGAGLFGAIANVCFPSLTIVSTAMIGSAAVTVSFDYFVEKMKMAVWVWSHVKGKVEPDFCWFSWLLLGLWPTLVMLGVLIQCLVTGKGFTIHTYPYKKRQPTRRRLTREERALARQAKYRYLYQIRTAGGDILSQAYIQQLHKPQVDTMSTHMSTLPTQEDTTGDE